MRGWGIRYKMLFLALFPALMIGAGLYFYFTYIYAAGMERALLERGTSLVENLAP